MKLIYKKLKNAIECESGFSLIELLIAAAFIAIVATGFMITVEGNTRSITRLGQVQTVREKSAGKYDTYFLKADNVLADQEARIDDENVEPYKEINVTITGGPETISGTCYKINDTGVNLYTFVKKPTGP